MPKLKHLAFIGLVFLISVISQWQVSESQASHPSVTLATTPPINQVLPFEAEAKTPQTPVQLELQAVDGAGQPLSNVRLGITLLAPARNPWLPTDFPIVEGTTLLDMEAQAPDGALRMLQMLPIRGLYHLLVKVEPIEENTFTPFQQQLTLSVRENPIKYRNFGILAAVLIGIGLLGGWVIGEGRSVQTEEIAPGRVRLLLTGAVIVAIASLLVINLSTVIAESHTHSADTHSHGAGELQDKPSGTNTAITATVTGDVASTVGQLANLSVDVIDNQTGQPATDVMLEVNTVSLEDGWSAFAYSGFPDAAGKLAWQQQFFDGAPHVVEVNVVPQSDAARQFLPVQISQTVDVTGIVPPLSSRLIVLAYLTCFVIIGLLIGLQLSRSLAAR